MITTFKFVGNVALFLILLDVFILVMSLAQVASGEPTGYWSPFWRVQAEFLLSLI